MGARRVTHVARVTQENSVSGPQEGRLETACCSPHPLLRADEEGVPTRGLVNGGKSYEFPIYN